VKVDSAVENRQSQDGRNVKAIGLMVLMFSLYFAYIGVSASSRWLYIYLVYVKVNNAVENRQSQDRQISKQQSQGVRGAVDLHACMFVSLPRSVFVLGGM
jgi:hypothetical protein